MLGAMENFDAGNLTYQELSNLGTTPEQIAQNIKDSQFTKEQQRRADKITSQKIGDETPTGQGVDPTQQITEYGTPRGGTGTQVPGGISYVGDDPFGDTSSFSTPSSQPSSNTSSGYSDQGPSDGYSDSPSDTNNDSGGFGDMSGMDFNIGGLAGKNKKTKPKKMKRGGLASKK